MDTFYIDDPTLGFININTGKYSFTYPEYLSLAMAKVWAGKADLPCTAELWRRYDKVVKDRDGYSKVFQFLDPDRMNTAVRFFLGWLNADAVKYGGRQIDAVPDTREIDILWNIAHISGPGSAMAASIDGNESWVHDFAFNDYW